MRVYTGTSGYSYKGWKGSFYPEDLPADRMLGFYSERLDAVEINNTFYRQPNEKMIASWAQRVPEHFRFAIKASRRITHTKRLREAGEETGYLLRTLTGLDSRLGVVLFQLPPNLQKDLPRLETFLAEIPDGTPAAVEFRHASWFTEEIYGCLKKNGVALCISDTDERTTPRLLTANRCYIRLRRSQYTEKELEEWINFLAEAGLAEAFVFFKHEKAGVGPALASRFAEKAG
jgi:uncharacterized protein YecE (DUF72 family)